LLQFDWSLLQKQCPIIVQKYWSQWVHQKWVQHFVLIFHNCRLQRKCASPFHNEVGNNNQKINKFNLFIFSNEYRSKFSQHFKFIQPITFYKFPPQSHVLPFQQTGFPKSMNSSSRQTNIHIQPMQIGIKNGNINNNWI